MKIFPNTHVDTQTSSFYGHVILRLMIHFLYSSQPNVSKNIFFYQFVHLSESILGLREKFSQHSPFRCIHLFSQKLVMISKFFKEKLEVISFQKHVGFSARQLIFLFSLFFYHYHLFISVSCLFLFFPFFFMRYFAT